MADQKTLQVAKQPSSEEAKKYRIKSEAVFEKPPTLQRGVVVADGEDWLAGGDAVYQLPDQPGALIDRRWVSGG